jgi:hypothetical protein
MTSTLVRQAIEAGRLHNQEEAAKEASSLWEERERRRAEILASVDIAEASIARGEGRVITVVSMRQLANDVSERGRARLAADQHQQPALMAHQRAPAYPRRFASGPADFSTCFMEAAT